jgi:hypothetical protein
LSSPLKGKGEEDGFLPAFKKIKNVSDETEAFNRMMDKARKESEDDRMMDKARKESEDDWHKRVDKYIEGGLNEKEAKKKADERMHTIDMNSFYKLHGSFLLSLIQLNDGPIHKKVMSDIDKFIEKGYDNKQSIKWHYIKSYINSRLCGILTDMNLIQMKMKCMRMTSAKMTKI